MLSANIWYLERFYEYKGQCDLNFFKILFFIDINLFNKL